MDQIFVSIASYRDTETSPTILDLYQKAKNPENISIGLCLQHDTNEIQISPNIPNIKILEYNWRQSQGTCWARHNIQKLLFSDENYYLQLDSHHKFCEHWDEILIQILKQLKNICNKPIIGGYCPSYKPGQIYDPQDRPMQINCFSDFTDQGDLMFYPRTIRDVKTLQEKQILTISARFLSGHFIFSESSFIKECPYDPNMYFRGEELSLSARAYTHGYDFFHPTQSIIWHEYIRTQQKKHWNDHTKNNGFVNTAQQRSNNGKARARYLLGIENQNMNFGKYGLGHQRSLHEYELYAGLKFSTKQVHKYAYDNRNVYPYAKVLSEQEWQDGLMNKYEINMPISNTYINYLNNVKDLKNLLIIFHDNKNQVLNKKEIKKFDLHTLLNNYHTELSMESEPKSIILKPVLNDQSYGQIHTITNFKIL